MPKTSASTTSRTAMRPAMTVAESHAPARSLCDSFSETSVRARRISFCRRSATSPITSESARGSAEFFRCSAMIAPSRRFGVVRRLDGRGVDRTRVLERPEHEETCQRREPEYQGGLLPCEIRGGPGQLIDRLILHVLRVV